MEGWGPGEDGQGSFAWDSIGACGEGAVYGACDGPPRSVGPTMEVEWSSRGGPVVTTRGTASLGARAPIEAVLVSGFDGAMRLRLSVPTSKRVNRGQGAGTGAAGAQAGASDKASVLRPEVG